MDKGRPEVMGERLVSIKIPNAMVAWGVHFHSN